MNFQETKPVYGEKMKADNAYERKEKKPLKTITFKKVVHYEVEITKKEFIESVKIDYPEWTKEKRNTVWKALCDKTEHGCITSEYDDTCEDWEDYNDAWTDIVDEAEESISKE